MTQDEIIQINYQHVGKSVCQLYAREGLRELRGVGTGVLLKIFDMHLLLTAGHCLYDENSDRKALDLKRSYINAGNEIIGLGGDGVRVESGDSKYISVGDDVAWMRLNPDVVGKLRKHRIFLGVEHLSVKDNYAANHRFMIIGVRGFTTKRADNLTIKDVTPTGYMALPVDDSFYRRGKFGRDRTLLLRFNRRKAYMVLTGKREMIAFPSGVSGGAVFTCSRITNGVEHYILPKLVGIVNTFDEHLGHLFVTTKLDPYIYAIMGRYKINAMSRKEGEVLLGFPHS